MALIKIQMLLGLLICFTSLSSMASGADWPKYTGYASQGNYNGYYVGKPTTSYSLRPKPAVENIPEEVRQTPPNNNITSYQATIVQEIPAQQPPAPMPPKQFIESNGDFIFNPYNQKSNQIIAITKYYSLEYIQPLMSSYSTASTNTALNENGSHAAALSFLDKQFGLGAYIGNTMSKRFRSEIGLEWNALSFNNYDNDSTGTITTTSSGLRKNLTAIGPHARLLFDFWKNSPTSGAYIGLDASYNYMNYTQGSNYDITSGGMYGALAGINIPSSYTRYFSISYRYSIIPATNFAIQNNQLSTMFTHHDIILSIKIRGS